MLRLTLDDHELIDIIKFPDGHQHLRLKRPASQYLFRHVTVSIKSFDDLFLLAQFRELLPHIDILYINYLLAARCDRKFSDGEALDLKIVTNFINGLKFRQVIVLKPHSDVSLALLDNATSRTKTSELFIACLELNRLASYSIISPDAGASKWIEKELGRTDIIQCSKDRDILSGEIKGIKIPEQPRENCIIVDDLCDGGATFINIAKQLKSIGVANVYLVVNHGIFSKGFDVFTGLVDKIYCTNSFSDISHPMVYQISL